jgi:hypothetical protein
MNQYTEILEVLTIKTNTIDTPTNRRQINK